MTTTHSIRMHHPRSPRHPHSPTHSASRTRREAAEEVTPRHTQRTHRTRSGHTPLAQDTAHKQDTADADSFGISPHPPSPTGKKNKKQNRGSEFVRWKFLCRGMCFVPLKRNSWFPRENKDTRYKGPDWLTYRINAWHGLRLRAAPPPPLATAPPVHFQPARAPPTLPSTNFIGSTSFLLPTCPWPRPAALGAPGSARRSTGTMKLTALDHVATAPVRLNVHSPHGQPFCASHAPLEAGWGW